MSEMPGWLADASGWVVDPLSWLLLVGGGLFVVVGGIGLIRFPDLFSRMHAGGVTDTMGAGMILAGLILQSGWSLVTVKLVSILLFAWITAPTAAHALAKAALTQNLQPLLAEPEEASSSPPSTSSS